MLYKILLRVLLDFLCPSLQKRKRVIVFDTARNKKRRIFASGKWREVTIPQWDEYLGKYGAKRKPYMWNPGKRIGAGRECAQQDPLDKDERGSSSDILFVCLFYPFTSI
jgi:hypothetical protein